MNVLVLVLIGALIGCGLSMAGVDLFHAKEPERSSPMENRDRMQKDCYALGGEVKYTFYAKTKQRDESEEWACVLP